MAQADIGMRLFEAVIDGKSADVGYWLQHGADPNARDIAGATPLFYAGKTGDKTMIEILLVGGADPNKKSRYMGYTPLMTAAVFGDVEMVKVLLSHGASVNARNDDGHTVLTLVEDTPNKPAMVRFLKEHGATK
jgi:ankyrin repeat protein